MNLRSTIAAAALMALATGAQASPILYGTNLVQNGDAEAGTTGWSTYDTYSPIQSVAYGSNWVLPTQPGPADRGARMFAGTGSNAVGQQFYSFDAPTASPLAFSLAGWLGGWANQGDNAVFHVQFLDVGGLELGSATLGPVTAAMRGNVTGLFAQQTSGLVPVNTSQLGFWLSMERQGGGDNDGYADNLSFMLRAPNEVPEPGALALVALGLLALRLTRRG